MEGGCSVLWVDCVSRLGQLRAEPCLPASDFCTVSTFVLLSPSGPHLVACEDPEKRLLGAESVPAIQLVSVSHPGLGSTSTLRAKQLRVPWACPRWL